jgi:hypothetical protein
MDVTFVATPVGPDFRGEVIDVRTHECLARTIHYASAETAKSAAAAMWRVMQAQEARAVAA